MFSISKHFYYEKGSKVHLTFQILTRNIMQPMQICSIGVLNTVGAAIWLSAI